MGRYLAEWTKHAFSWCGSRRGDCQRRPRRRRFGSRTDNVRPRVEDLETRTLPSCIVSLTPSEEAPQLVGEQVRWTATATDCGANPVYQFRVGSTGGPLQLLRDFSPTNSFPWTPMQEGSYDVQAVVKDGYQGAETVSAQVSDMVNSRITGRHAVITPTSNPLVAVYSAPPCAAGEIHVEFAETGHHPDWRSTNTLPCEAGLSRNFLVAGMQPDTTYQMRDVVTDHHHPRRSSILRFATGSLPSNLAFPSYTVIQPPGPGSDLDQDMLFQQLGNSPSNAPNPLATDLSGNIVWYYDVSQSGFTRTYPGQSLVPGGTVLVLGVDPYAPMPGTLDALREIDLAGDPKRETNMDAVNAQLTARGYNPIFSFTHDVERLPNGATAVIGSTERTVDIDGVPTNYIGMTIIVLDQNFQVAWAWDAFDHLDVNRGPILGEVCTANVGDQVCSSTPSLPAVDWLHINAVSWSPADGNLVVSVRHQDWVLKIDYQGGEGDGHIIWRLGQHGDFTPNFSDPSLWFSHQHNPHFIDDTTLILFDNGNTRRDSDPNADSRGQVWTIDEQTMTATLVFNADLGTYSSALGAAERLSNGNYSFTAGFEPRQSIEVLPDGTPTYILQVGVSVFRSFRMRTLYEGTNPPVDVPHRNDSRSSFEAIGVVFATPRETPAETLTSVTRVSPSIPTRLANSAPAAVRLDWLFSADTARTTPVLTRLHAQDAVLAELAGLLIDTLSWDLAP